MIEVIIIMFILLNFSFILLYFLSDEYCDKEIEKIIKERIEK